MDCRNLTEADMNLDIELREHKGIVTTAFGEFEVTHPQWMVMALNRENEQIMHVGYLGTHDGAPFNGTLQLGAMPVSLQEEIIAAVEKKVGRALRSVVPPNYAALDADVEEDADLEVDEE